MQVNDHIIHRFSSVRREKIQKLDSHISSCFCIREEKPSVYLYVKIALSQYAGLWDRTYRTFDICLSLTRTDIKMSLLPVNQFFTAKFFKAHYHYWPFH